MAGPTATEEMLAFEEGEILLQDSFSDPTSGWDDDVFEEAEIGYTDGAYRILVKDEDLQFWGNSGFDLMLDALRLEVEATQLAGASGDLIGARCYTDVDSDVGYLVGIATAERGYLIAAFRRGDYRLSVRGGGRRRPSPRGGEPAASRVRRLARRADRPNARGERPGACSAEDNFGGHEFDGVGLFVDTTAGGAEALFDDVVVTELLPR